MARYYNDLPPYQDPTGPPVRRAPAAIPQQPRRAAGRQPFGQAVRNDLGLISRGLTDLARGAAHVPFDVTGGIPDLMAMGQNYFGRTNQPVNLRERQIQAANALNLTPSLPENQMSPLYLAGGVMSPAIYGKGAQLAGRGIEGGEAAARAVPGMARRATVPKQPGLHLSQRADMGVLDPRMAGSNPMQLGAERGRTGAQPSVHFYAPGVTPEANLGREGYRATLKGVLPKSGKRGQKLWKQARRNVLKANEEAAQGRWAATAPQTEVASEFERLARDKGYTGIRGGDVIKSFDPVVPTSRTYQAVPSPSQSNIERYIQQQANEGFSIDPRTGEVPRSGYMVSQRGGEQTLRPGQPIGDVDLGAIPPGEFLGGWRKPSGEMVLDASRQYPGLLGARAAAEGNYQQALWDVAGNKPIPATLRPAVEDLPRTLGQLGKRRTAQQWSPFAASPKASMFHSDLSPVADFGKKARAMEMSAAGANRDDIWKETGWFKDPSDDIWKFETPDIDARLTDEANLSHEKAQRFTGTMPQYLEHPGLYEAAPQARENIVATKPMAAGMKGMYQPEGATPGAGPRIVLNNMLPSPMARVRTALHEGMHGIQQGSGMARGSGSGDPFYWNRPGEAMARNVENRYEQAMYRVRRAREQGLSEEQARQAGVDWYESNAPWTTLDIPEENIAANLPGREAFESAAKPARLSRAEAEAAGYWHPVGAGKRLKKPFPELRAETSPVGEMPPATTIDPASLQGRMLIPALGDRTEAGRMLTSVGGNPLESPVRLEGGHGFMRENPQAAWASDKGKATTLANKARMAMDMGLDPALVYTPMGHGTANFNTMMADALLEQVRGGNISRTAKEQFDRRLRKLRPEWKGIDNPESIAMLESNGALRHAFANISNLEHFQKRGFPDMAETRFALTDPNLMNTPLHQGGQSISSVTGDILPNPAQPHKTYNTQLAGDYLGGLSGGVPREILFPEFTSMRRAAGAPVSGDPRSFDLGIPTQMADQEWLDRVMRYLQTSKTGR